MKLSGVKMVSWNALRTVGDRLFLLGREAKSCGGTTGIPSGLIGGTLVVSGLSAAHRVVDCSFIDLTFDDDDAVIFAPVNAEEEEVIAAENPLIVSCELEKKCVCSSGAKALREVCVSAVATKSLGLHRDLALLCVFRHLRRICHRRVVTEFQ